MPRYRTLDVDNAEAELQQRNLEAIIADGKLIAVIANGLRIFPDKGALVITMQEGYCLKQGIKKDG